jgi:UDP-GlcNAc:undecaprenyl-phosphate GlcNAc-1-phosphate transferase
MLYLAHGAQLAPEAMMMLLLSSATLAFACVNVPWWPKSRASAFMGDAGSMVLGFTLVYFALHLSQAPTQAFMPAAILWILIVPVSDIIYVTLTRLLKKRSPLAAGRDHIHHLELAYGFSARQTLGLSLFLALFGAMIAIVFTKEQWSDNLLFWLFIVWIAAYCTCASYAWRRRYQAKMLRV